MSFHEYPKMKYSPFQQPRIVKSHKEELALAHEGNWFDKPDFTNHSKPEVKEAPLDRPRPDKKRDEVDRRDRS